MKKFKLHRSLGKAQKLLLGIPETDGNESDVVTVSEDGFDYLWKNLLGIPVDEEIKSVPKPMLKAKTEIETK